MLQHARHRLGLSSGRRTSLTLRPFPHPYRAAVAISNDCEFMGWSDFLALYRILNGPEELGLEVGTSLFFYVTNALCHSSFGYFEDLGNTPSPHAPQIRELVRAGYIDTVHAYGDFDDGTFVRGHAERVVAECERHGMRFPVWTNHGSDQNFQNLGHHGLTGHQQGDDPASPFYHLDLLRQIGATYFWVDDGYQQAVADGTPLLYSETARDGSTLRLMRRYRGLAGKPAPMAASLPEQMTVADLDLLVERSEACIYYQHLGAWERTGPTQFVSNRPPYLSPAGRRVLEHLADLYRRGDCLVTTPARLVRYLAARNAIELRRTPDDDVVIRSAEPLAADALEGLAVCSASPIRTLFREDEAGRVHPVETARAEVEEGTCVFVPWKRLPDFTW